MVTTTTKCIPVTTTGTHNSIVVNASGQIVSRRGTDSEWMNDHGMINGGSLLELQAIHAF